MLQPDSAIRRLLRLLLAAAAATMFCRFLFRPLLPLLLAFLLSGLLCRPVDTLCKKLPLPRGLCTLLLTFLLCIFVIPACPVAWSGPAPAADPK